MYLLLKLYKDVLQKLFGISFIYLILLLFNLILISCGSQNKKESAEFFERANYHFKKGDFERAIQLYDECIEKTPEFADAYNNKALVLQAMQKNDEAIVFFNKAIEIDPKFDLAKLNLAKTYSEIGDTEKAEKIFNELEIAYKDSSDFYYYRGLNEFRNDNIKNASFDFKKSYDLNNENSLTLNALGVIAFEEKDFETAKKYFKKAIETSPKNYISMSNLALSNFNLNEKASALNLAKTAYKYDNLNEDIYNNLIYIYLESDSLEQAKNLIDLNTGKPDLNPYFQRNTGIYWLKSGDKNKANGYFQKAFNINPKTDQLDKYYPITSRN